MTLAKPIRNLDCKNTRTVSPQSSESNANTRQYLCGVLESRIPHRRGEVMPILHPFLRTKAITPGVV